MDLSEEQVKALARKYLEGGASEEEKRLLHAWYDTANAGDLEIVISQGSQSLDSFRQEIWTELSRMREEAKETKQADKSKESEGSKEPEEPGLPEEEKRGRVLPWRRVAVAACVLLLLGIGVRRLFYPHPPKSIVVEQNNSRAEKKEVLPGGNRAVLTLANGQTIMLDSAGNGELARQGNTRVVKLANGQLAYDIKNGEGAKGELLYNTMSTPRGGQYRLALPDGTEVWLNAASSIRYPTAFTGKERKVEVTGEAYFEVARNKDQPFVVLVNKTQRIAVLGTHFNVNAYEDEASINTTLLEGSVRVSGLDPAKGPGEGPAKLLAPGQQTKLDKRGSITVIEDANTEAAVAWKNGVFLFDHADIQAVVRQLARWYDMEVEYRGKPTEDLFGGDIQRNLPLTKVFRILERSQVHFSIEGRKMIVMP